MICPVVSAVAAGHQPGQPFLELSPVAEEGFHLLAHLAVRCDESGLQQHGCAIGVVAVGLAVLKGNAQLVREEVHLIILMAFIKLVPDLDDAVGIILIDLPGFLGFFPSVLIQHLGHALDGLYVVAVGEGPELRHIRPVAALPAGEDPRVPRRRSCPPPLDPIEHHLELRQEIFQLLRILAVFQML